VLDPQGYEPIGIEARIDVESLLEAPREQTRCRDQDDGDRNLSDDEHAPKAGRVGAARRGT
jgi:hypothetical protein